MTIKNFVVDTINDKYNNNNNNNNNNNGTCIALISKIHGASQ